jgi:hypothetical protein
MKDAIMLKEIEAESAIENCRALIDQIDADLCPLKGSSEMFHRG